VVSPSHDIQNISDVLRSWWVLPRIHEQLRKELLPLVRLFEFAVLAQKARHLLAVLDGKTCPSFFVSG